MKSNKQANFGKQIAALNLPTDHVELLWRTLMYSVGSFTIVFFFKYAL